MPPSSKTASPARDRHNAAFADVESDRRDVGGGIAPAVVSLRWLSNFRRQQVGERHHAVRQLLAEAAYVANGKHVGSDVHGALSVVERADVIAGDDCLSADTGERDRRVVATVEQRQRGHDHLRPQHAERRQKILDDIGQLNADDRVGRQSHIAQPRRNGTHNAIGFGVGEVTWVSAGKACAVERVDQRQRVRPALSVAMENVVERERKSA